MTFEEFKIATRKRNAFDIIFYHGICIMVILLGLMGFYYRFSQPEKFKQIVVFVSLMFISFILLGLYGIFVLLPNRYKIIEVPSGLSLEKKQLIASQILEEIAEINFAIPGQHMVFKTKAKWWQSKYTVHFFYDEYKFAFSVQGHDYNGGFIDFGGTERKRKEVAAKIEELISY